jgi:hypothetical protein
MPFSYEPDDMQENFSICMKKSENGPLIGGVGDLVKMMDRGRKLDQNEACALLPLDKSPPYDHRWVLFSYGSDVMQGKFSICMKKFENGPLREN